MVTFCVFHLAFNYLASQSVQKMPHSPSMSTYPEFGSVLYILTSIRHFPGAVLFAFAY